MTVIASGDSMTVGVGEKDFKINPGSWVKYYCQMTGKKMVPIAKNGQQVNHLRLSFPPPAPLPKSEISSFNKEKEDIIALLK